MTSVSFLDKLRVSSGGEPSLPTIYDVANAANVSPKTVSRVLNGDAPVGKRTRESVEAAIAELGYVPSNAARMMRSNRSGLIGLITGALSQNLEPMEPVGLPALYIVKGIQQVIGDSVKTLMIADTGGKSDKVPKLMRTFSEHRVEALIYVADHHCKVELDTSSVQCPVTLVNCFDEGDTAAIVPDDQQCQFNLVTDLIQSGHKRIAYLSLDDSIVATSLRSEGYRKALLKAGLEYDPLLHIVAVKNSEKDSERLGQALDSVLSLSNPPSVICCGNDEMALHLYGLIRSQGLQIPEDISVAGFDNYRAIAKTLYPPLTTVELPYLAMGHCAAQVALKLCDNPVHKLTKALTVPGEVFWRSSVTDRNSVSKINTTQKRKII